MPKRSLIAAVVSVAALAFAGTALSATKTVRVADNVFRPSSTSVKRGDTVVFRWVGRNPHNVRVTRGPQRFQSRVIRSGSYRRTLTRRGSYRIVCDIHDGMRMTLRVR